MLFKKKISIFSPEQKKVFENIAQEETKIENSRKNIHKQLENLKEDEDNLDMKKLMFVDQFYQNTKTAEISNILDVIKKSGHPHEKREAEKLLEKYYKEEKLEYNDLEKLDLLYQSNFDYFQ